MISSDSIAKEDLLGRKKFAKQIVNSLTKTLNTNEESFVVGINGPWGSGKSTLLAFMEAELTWHYRDDPEMLKVIHFNPWANTSINHEELEREFLETLIKELQSIHWKNSLEEKQDTFKSYLKYLNYLRFVRHVHPVAENIVGAIEDYTNQSAVHSITEVKKQADKLISEKGIKLYIFLDDLDRLTHQELATIFRIIKLNVNFLNTCFIVAYDKAVVARALDANFNSKGEQYLEKIIQVDFTVPVITEENMEDLFSKEISLLMQTLDLPFDDDSLNKVWKFWGLKEYFRTLRDIRRYVNSLFFSLPNITKDINLTDFLILEAIKVFDYSAYQKIYNDFLIIQRQAVWKSIAFDKGTIEQYHHETTKSLLDYLFLQKDSISFFMSGASNSKRLCDRTYFTRYYTLYISARDISEDDLIQFLVGRNREQILEEAVKKGTIKNLLKRLSDSDLSKDHPIADTFILESFLKFWDQHSYGITNELDEYIWHCYFNMAHCLENKFEAAKTAIENLVLNETQPQPMRLVFNHFILLFHEEHREDREIRGHIKDQVAMGLDKMKKALEQHIKKLWSHYSWNAIRRESPFVGRIFIEDSAKYVPAAYNNVLETYFEDSRFILFLLKYFFLVIDKDGTPLRIDLEKKDLLLPENRWDRFVDFLKEAKKGSWDEKDQKLVDYFWETIADS